MPVPRRQPLAVQNHSRIQIETRFPRDLSEWVSLLPPRVPNPKYHGLPHSETTHEPSVERRPHLTGQNPFYNHQLIIVAARQSTIMS